MNKERIKKEALMRLDMLTEELNLNPNIKKYYEEGELYYSYVTGGGLLGSIDTISYVPEYEEIVKEFEETYHCHVYHAIEDSFGMMSLLYVSEHEEEWPYQRPEGKYLYACVCVFDQKRLEQGEYVVSYEEFGSIICSSMDGAIVRIG